MSAGAGDKSGKMPNWDALRKETKPKKGKKKKKKKKRGDTTAKSSATPAHNPLPAQNKGSSEGPAAPDISSQTTVKPEGETSTSTTSSGRDTGAELKLPPPAVVAKAPELPQDPTNHKAPAANEDSKVNKPAVVKPSTIAAGSPVPTDETPAVTVETSSMHSSDKQNEPRIEGVTPLPRVIVVANQKGGVGKTTTTVSIAASVAEAGFRTLVVDLDPQANASTGLGLNPHSLESSVYHALLHNVAAEDIIEPSEVENLFVLPSSLDLAGAEIELVPAMTREYRLKKAIDSVIDDYDYVFIDCPPSLGLLTINALTAASEVLVPIQCEYYALEGLGQLMSMVEMAQGSLNEDLRISHIVLVMFDSRTRLGGQVVDEVREHFGDLVCKNVIPRTVRLSEAPSFGQPITVFDPESTGALAYKAVAEEVIRG